MFIVKMNSKSFNQKIGNKTNLSKIFYFYNLFDGSYLFLYLLTFFITKLQVRRT